jgi:hypothetical protein
MASIKKAGPWNPQKAEAYVGKGVLKTGGKITPVPNGHLIKKDGTSLKKGGKIDAFSKVKKAMKPKKEKMLMDKIKKNLYKVQPIKKENGGNISCWTGYVKQGTKKKGGKTVNNCVKKVMKNGGSTPAWTRKEGKNPTGGLNAKGRASYNRANPGSNLKAPQPQGGPRKRSFCARMSGVKGPATKPNGEPTRKTLALRKWKC